MSVNSKKFVHFLLIIRGNRTGSRTDRFTGKIKILADMTSIDRNDFVSGNSIAPLHSIWDCCPYKSNSGLSWIGLTKNPLNNLTLQVLFRKFEQELMLDRKIAIYSLIQSPDIKDAEIGFECMAAAGRRDRS